MHPLIDAAGLAAALRTGRPPAVLDVRWQLGGPSGIAAYRAGHLPGAVFVDLDRDLAGPPGPGGRHPLPPPDAFQAAMRRAGVDDGGEVVVYDEAGQASAARAWWVLRYYGHGRVRVLDGGLQAWLAAGAPAESGEPLAVPAGDFTARPGHMPALDAAGAARVARRGVLLDARAPERYRGDTEPVDPVAGHIPGAVSAPAATVLAPDGRYLTADRLREWFAALGAAAGGLAVGAYCGSGVTAAQEVLALEVAGISAALYPGSWSDWVRDPDRPVATGGEPG